MSNKKQPNTLNHVIINKQGVSSRFTFLRNSDKKSKQVLSDLLCHALVVAYNHAGGKNSNAFMTLNALISGKHKGEKYCPASYTTAIRLFLTAEKVVTADMMKGGKIDNPQKDTGDATLTRSTVASVYKENIGSRLPEIVAKIQAGAVWTYSPEPAPFDFDALSKRIDTLVKLAIKNGSTHKEIETAVSKWTKEALAKADG